jgi:hypothetical protein
VNKMALFARVSDTIFLYFTRIGGIPLILNHGFLSFLL